MKSFSSYVSVLFMALGISFFLFPFLVSADDAANQAVKDCIEANSGTGNPVDVCYHSSAEMAYLNDFADFSSKTSVGDVLQGGLSLLMGVVGGLALLAIMIGGGMIMLGGTDESMLERGKDILKYTAIGVAIVLLAVTITTIVQTFFYSVDT